MIFNSYRGYSAGSGFASFGGPWEDWCDQHYGPNGSTPDPTLLAKCNTNIPFIAPWTVVGRSMRGLPASDAGVATAPPVSGAGLIGGASSGILYIGLGLAGLALVMTMRKRRRS